MLRAISGKMPGDDSADWNDSQHIREHLHDVRTLRVPRQHSYVGRLHLPYGPLWRSRRVVRRHHRLHRYGSYRSISVLFKRRSCLYLPAVSGNNQSALTSYSSVTHGAALMSVVELIVSLHGTPSVINGNLPLPVQVRYYTDTELYCLVTRHKGVNNLSKVVPQQCPTGSRSL